MNIRDTWHWRLATVYGMMEDCSYRDQKFNACSYGWKVFAGVFNILVILAIATLLSWFIGNVLGWAIAMAMIGFNHIQPEPIVVGTLVGAMTTLIVFGGVWILLSIMEYRERRKQRRRNEEISQILHPIEPSPLALWYKGIKEKTCHTFQVPKKY